MIIAERFIKVRDQAELSSVTIFNISGILAEELTAYETGKRIPRDSIKAALADPYQTPIIEQFFLLIHKQKPLRKRAGLYKYRDKTGICLPFVFTLHFQMYSIIALKVQKTANF